MYSSPSVCIPPATTIANYFLIIPTIACIRKGKFELFKYNPCTVTVRPMSFKNSEKNESKYQTLPRSMSILFRSMIHIRSIDYLVPFASSFFFPLAGDLPAPFSDESGVESTAAGGAGRSHHPKKAAKARARGRGRGAVKSRRGGVDGGGSDTSCSKEKDTSRDGRRTWTDAESDRLREVVGHRSGE